MSGARIREEVLLRVNDLGNSRPPISTIPPTQSCDTVYYHEESQFALKYKQIIRWWTSLQKKSRRKTWSLGFLKLHRSKNNEVIFWRVKFCLHLENINDLHIVFFFFLSPMKLLCLNSMQMNGCVHLMVQFNDALHFLLWS